MFRLIAYAIHRALKLGPQGPHASLFSTQPVQSSAGKVSPMDASCDVALFLGAAQEPFASRVARCPRECVCRVAYVIPHALKLEPQNLHASLPGIQSAQTPAGKISPLDDIRDAALFLSAAQEFLARLPCDALKALRLREGRG